MDKTIIKLESQYNHHVDVLDLKEPVYPTVKHVATYSDGTTAEISQEAADAYADGLVRGMAIARAEQKITQVTSEQGDSVIYVGTGDLFDLGSIPVIEVYEPEEFEYFEALDFSQPAAFAQPKSPDEILASFGWKREEIVGQLPMVGNTWRLLRPKKPTPPSDNA